MIAYPVSRFLVQFGVENEPEEAVTADPAAGVLQPLSKPGRVEEPQENNDALIENAREEGRREALAMAQAQLETSLADVKAVYENHLVEQRNAWIAGESEKLSAAFIDAVAQMEVRLAEAVDAVLRPLLIDSLRHQIVDELVQNVNVLLAGESPVIEISGAPDLLMALQVKLSSAAATIDYKPADSIDVRVVAHNTIIESQLRAWIERFELSKEPN